MLCHRVFRFPASRITNSLGSLTLMFVLAGMPAQASTLPEGWQSESITAAPGGLFLGGFDLLPNGNFVLFDGSDILEISSADGSTIRTIFTPPGFVFGSFVRVHPNGTTLYFGESSNGDIYEVDIASGVGAAIANLTFNFDMKFDPSGRAFVSAASGPNPGNYIHLVDPVLGTTTEVINIAGFSGPLAFDDQGDLYLGQPDDDFPPAIDGARVLRFEKAIIDGALGGGRLLDESFSSVYADGLPGTGSMSFDREWDLHVSEGWFGTITAIPAGGGAPQELWNGGGTEFPAFLAYGDEGGCGTFSAFQPEDTGTLHFVATDFFSFNDARRVRPQRPSLDVTPGTDIPVGPFTLSLADGPSLGQAFLAVTTDALDPEQAFIFGGVTVCLGVDFATLLSVVALPLDANGGIDVLATNPGGLGGASVAVQALEASGIGLVGSSNPLVLSFQ